MIEIENNLEQQKELIAKISSLNEAKATSPTELERIRLEKNLLHQKINELQKEAKILEQEYEKEKLKIDAIATSKLVKELQDKITDLYQKERDLKSEIEALERPLDYPSEPQSIDEVDSFMKAKKGIDYENEWRMRKAKLMRQELPIIEREIAEAEEELKKALFEEIKPLALEIMESLENAKEKLKILRKESSKRNFALRCLGDSFDAMIYNFPALTVSESGIITFKPSKYR